MYSTATFSTHLPNKENKSNLANTKNKFEKLENSEMSVDPLLLLTRAKPWKGTTYLET